MSNKRRVTSHFKGLCTSSSFCRKIMLLLSYIFTGSPKCKLLVFTVYFTAPSPWIGKSKILIKFDSSLNINEIKILELDFFSEAYVVVWLMKWIILKKDSHFLYLKCCYIFNGLQLELVKSYF